MGVDSKKASVLPLPAPTETDSTTPTELATDVSKTVDGRSSYSLPEDGTPVTIKTRGHKPNRSQTSFLIEWFEGGKSGASSAAADRQPSVRVRLTPSKSRKSDHFQITETKSTRKTSLTRRSAPDTPVAADALGDVEDAKSMSSYASATEESNVSRNPIEVEIDRGAHHRRRRPASPLIPPADASSKGSYQPGTRSEISTIPTDSFLDGSGYTNKTSEARRSRSPSRTADVLAGAAAGLAAAAVADKVRSKSRSEEKERVVLPKARDKEKSDRKHRSSRSRTSSVSERDGVKSPRRRSSRGHQQESVVSAAESSVVSSALSPSHRSYDQHSIRSGASKSSINNPKLLETVEDAIRRLILPELDALKRETSRKGRRSSVTSSGTSVSREEYASERRRSGASDKHGPTAKDSVTRLKESRDREARHEFDSSPAHSVDHGYVESTHSVDDTPSRSGDKAKAAVAAAALGGLAAAAALQDKSSPVTAREQRRRRRAEAKSRSSERHVEEHEESDYLQPPPLMPMMSDINASEVTRTSIQSAETDRPHSASEELTPVQEVSRGHFGALDAEPGSPTPTRTPATLQSLGTQHANISHGDLKALPRSGPADYPDQEYEVEEYGRRMPLQSDEYDEDEYDEAAHDPAAAQHGGYDFYGGHQEVPAPLKYVPYQPERRGLSPIPSVSGYTEGGGSEIQANRDSRITTTTTSSPEKSPHHERILHSPGSVPSNVMSRDFDADDQSMRSSGMDYRNTQYTDDSLGAGQAVRGVGANPDIVHTPIGVESAVASLVDGSMLDDSLLTGESGYGGREYPGHRDSMDTLEEERSHGHASLSKHSLDSRRALEEHDDGRGSPTTTRTNPSEFEQEYELDHFGRKVQKPMSASEAAITAGAVGLAIKAAQAKSKQPAAEEDAYYEEEGEDEAAAEQQRAPVGIQRNLSFKERTRDGHQLANTPTHSMDRLLYEQPKMDASAVPDMSDPIPAIGYGYHDDLETNPSIIEGHDMAREHWSGNRTPTQQRHGHDDLDNVQHGGSGHNLARMAEAGAAGAAALAAAHALASAQHSQHASQPEQEEEWQRNSDERKRDTLITNPYEGTSPVVNLPDLNEGLFKSTIPGVGYGGDYSTGSPLNPKLQDEGYISQGPNKSPDIGIGVKGKNVEFQQPGLAAHDDPFYTPKHTRHLSGMSQGMGSPLYDAATGDGIERIENKDIIALMQHLMVRDAQRSARDTEILMTLVRSATEMRTSFEDVKSMLAAQEKGLHTEFARRMDLSENNIITEVMESTEKTVRNHIGGPRPYPGSAARSLQGGSQADTDDLPAKKRNLFRRALKGLSAKGNNDLGRIEEMLMQLLGEVDALKAQTAQAAGNGSQRAQSFDNVEPDVPFEQDHGYEPEGHAGTSTASHASQSGHLSIGSRGPSTKLGYERKFSDHRISTVPEANEEDVEPQDSNLNTHFSKADTLVPHSTAQRGSSAPLATPPQAHVSQQASLSNENTPRTEKGKKHKSSGSSGWIPKISRWSETTTSSVRGVFRSSKDSRKDQDLGEFHSAPSRSGSDLAAYDDYPRMDPEGDDKLHTGFSEPDLHSPAHEYQTPHHQHHHHHQIPPHPKTYMTPEDPKYKAHRNSLNLQHPQPRSGQPFRAALESGAEHFSSPTSPGSAHWAGSTSSLHRFPGGQANNPNRYSDESAAQEARQHQYWTASPGPVQSTGPPRPPKEPLDERVSTPPKSNRISRLQKTSPLPYHSVESGYHTATHAPTSYTGSPRLENRNLSGALGVPTRRPSGPRAMTPKSEKSVGSLDEDDTTERQRKRATFGTVASQESEAN